MQVSNTFFIKNVFEIILVIQDFGTMRKALQMSDNACWLCPIEGVTKLGTSI